MRPLGAAMYWQTPCFDNARVAGRLQFGPAGQRLGNDTRGLYALRRVLIWACREAE